MLGIFCSGTDRVDNLQNHAAIMSYVNHMMDKLRILTT